MLIPVLIASVHAALVKTAAPAEPEVPAGPVAATTARKSLSSPDRIISMIDGKPYQTLKRHITRHGYTAESYRAAFGLPRDYPMVAAGYSSARREISLKIGLGRKKISTAAVALENPVKTAAKKLGIVAGKGAAAHPIGDAKPAAKRDRPARITAEISAPIDV
jgi:predicted transcriptional regulator